MRWRNRAISQWTILNNIIKKYQEVFSRISFDKTKRLLDMSTTTIYNEDGSISKSTNYIIRDPLLAEIQKEYLQPVITQYFASNKSEIWS